MNRGAHLTTITKNYHTHLGIGIQSHPSFPYQDQEHNTIPSQQTSQTENKLTTNKQNQSSEITSSGKRETSLISNLIICLQHRKSIKSKQKTNLKAIHKH
jgi:hypothetical protein